VKVEETPGAEWGEDPCSLGDGMLGIAILVAIAVGFGPEFALTYLRSPPHFS
jgi:hypothetical protein